MFSPSDIARVARILGETEARIIAVLEQYARQISSEALGLADFPPIQAYRETESRDPIGWWAPYVPEGRAAAATRRMRSAYTERPVHGGKMDYG